MICPNMRATPHSPNVPARSRLSLHSARTKLRDVQLEEARFSVRYSFQYVESHLIRTGFG